MKTRIALFLLSLASLTWGQVTPLPAYLTQFSYGGYYECGTLVSQHGATKVYSWKNDTCTIPLDQTTAYGNTQVFAYLDDYDGVVPQRTIVSGYTCAALDANGQCTADNAIDTIQPILSAYASGSVNTQSANTGIVLSGLGGANYVSITRSGHASVAMERYEIAQYELAGTCSVDDAETQGDNFLTTKHTMVETSPHQTDVIFQFFSGPVSPATVTPPYAANATVSAHFMYTYAETASGEPPVSTWARKSTQAGVGLALECP